MPAYRKKGKMAEQLAELLRHYQEHHGLTMSENSLLEVAVSRLWQEECGPLQPEAPYVAGWVRGRTKDGREGWIPFLSSGGVLDYIDDDIDEVTG